MTNKVFLLFSIFIYLNTFSQKTSTKKGNIVKDRQFLMDKNEITVSDNLGNFVSIRPHRNNGAIHNYYVEFFNNLNFENRIEIATQNKTKILDVFILNKKVYVFIKEQIDKTISLRCDIINLITKNKTQKILYEIDKDKSSELYTALKNDSNISLDYSSQIILSIPVVKDKAKFVFVKLFTSKFEETSQHSIYPDKSISHKNISFLNTSQYNKKVYLLFNLVYNKNNKVYKIIELNNGKERVLNIQIKAGTNELIYSQTKNAQLVISGLYSKQKKGGFEGFTNYNINLNSFTISSQNQSRFLNKEARNYFKGLFKTNRNVDIKNIFIDNQQNTYVISQCYVIKKQQVPIGIPIATIGSSIFITYNPISLKYKMYDDLIIAKIGSNGELIWDKIIELRQTKKIRVKSNKRDSSTSTFLSNNQISIFMNGFINMKKDKLIVKQDKKLSKTYFYNIEINHKGHIIPRIIISNKDSEIIFRAEKAVKSDNQFYILGQGNMRKQLLEFKL